MKQKRKTQLPFVFAKKQKIALSGEVSKAIIGQLDSMALQDRLLACKNLIGSDCLITLFCDTQDKISIIDIKLFAPTPQN